MLKQKLYRVVDTDVDADSAPWSFRYWPGIFAGALYTIFVWVGVVVMAIVIVVGSYDESAGYRALIVASAVGIVVIAIRHLLCRVRISGDELVIVNPWRRAVRFPRDGARYFEHGTAWFYVHYWTADVLIFHGQCRRAKAIATIGLPRAHPSYAELRRRLVAAGFEARGVESSDDPESSSQIHEA